ncbi:tRNA pseudouridine synthase D, putative [Plasmodium malariae]|uniref:tRNA pseudouridine synthase D, putative n=1 Tax=Plasmodium malariae TaxID=5858 RepID=A0A1C3K9V4_PLAMA|nr:tRNA pseudouridine synthase D, putative [Plasmodium malariae]
MFFRKSAKLLLVNSRATALSLAKNYNFISNLRYYLCDYLLEEHVGINHFMSDLLVVNNEEKKLDLKKREDLECVFKYKCEDFHVYEIEKNKNVLNLKYVKRKILDFHYSGFKDKRSVSTQVITTSRSNMKKIICIRNEYLKKKNKKILICNIEKVDKKIELGEHCGNHFIVVLRNVQTNKDYLRSRLNVIKKYGFINYFGMQRFGGYKNTFNKGKALICRNYKEYINFVLDPHIFENKIFYGNIIKDSVTLCLKNACNIYQRKKNATFAFQYFVQRMNKILRKNNVIPSSKLNNYLCINKYLCSYMTNSEYEAFILLRNLYMCEKNNKRGAFSNIERDDTAEQHHLVNSFNINLNLNFISAGGREEKNRHLITGQINCRHIKQKEYNFYKNEKTCVKGISMETRRFHMHSYSAKIFNMLTSYRLENFGVKLTCGDYVFTKKIQPEIAETKNQHNYITMLYDHNNHLDDLNIYNVVLPILGTLPNRLSYLNIFKQFYRKYLGQKVRIVFLEILLYLIYTLHEDNLFSAHCNVLIDNYVNNLIAKNRKNINQSIMLASQNILTRVVPIKQTLYIIKKFDTYINSFEYEYGMTCVFRNVVVLPKNLYYCFCDYNEPKVKFVSDLYADNFINNKILNMQEENNDNFNINGTCNTDKQGTHDGVIDNTHRESFAYNIVEKSEKLNSNNNHLMEYSKCNDENVHTQMDGKVKSIHCTSLKRKDEHIDPVNFPKDILTPCRNKGWWKKKERTYTYNFSALILSFNLNSSTYATMLVRELYGKRNELLVHNLIKNCQNYDKKIESLRQGKEGRGNSRASKMKN